MKKRVLVGLVLGLFVGLFGFAAEGEAAVMHRLYNLGSSEHFYTGSIAERNALLKTGWRYEGVAWVGPDQGDPVYRVYNPNVGDHHYTLHKGEKDSLVKAGWKDEGISWYSPKSGIPLYRVYNPQAQKAGAHHYTTSAGERDSLLRGGWKDEGVAWYADSEQVDTSDKVMDLFGAYQREKLDRYYKVAYISNLDVYEPISSDWQAVYRVKIDSGDQPGFTLDYINITTGEIRTMWNLPRK